MDIVSKFASLYHKDGELDFALLESERKLSELKGLKIEQAARDLVADLKNIPPRNETEESETSTETDEERKKEHEKRPCFVHENVGDARLTPFNAYTHKICKSCNAKLYHLAVYGLATGSPDDETLVEFTIRPMPGIRLEGK